MTALFGWKASMEIKIIFDWFFACRNRYYFYVKIILENKEGDEKLFNSFKENATELLKKKIVENDDSTLHTNLKRSYKKVCDMSYINENLLNDVSKLHYLIEGLR